MALVVSDTSPVRALAHLGTLVWLHDSFERIVVPPAVVQELQSPPGQLLAVTVTAWPFIEIQVPRSAVRIAELKVDLDLGEAEAIALAEEIKAEAISSMNRTAAPPHSEVVSSS
jgi:predicted nucleic acid-binding protein